MLQQTSLSNKTIKAYMTPVIPNDHGAYAMLIVPYIIGLAGGLVTGTAITPGIVLSSVLLGLSMLGCFFAREPLETLAKPLVNPATRRLSMFWLLVYLLVAGATGLPLLLIWQRWDLLWLGLAALAMMVVSLVAVRRRHQRSFVLRWFGIGGLALSAPAAYYIITGRLDGLALGLWVACWIYFTGTLIYVRMWFEAKKHEKTKSASRLPYPSWLFKTTWLYGILATLIMIGMFALNLFSPAILLAYLPMVIRLVYTAWKPPTWIPIKRLGILEGWQSVFFVAVLLLVIR